MPSVIGKKLKLGVPQGSLIGPLLFNVVTNEIFLFVRCTNICNFTGDTTTFVCHPTLETIARQLETDGTLLQNGFLTTT